MSISIEDIREAHERIIPHVHKTPVFTNKQINKISGCRLFFKCENFQRVGAFKARGGMNTVLQLTAENLKHGVTTHSSGNHAQAVALAAQIAGTSAYIVMPENAPKVKKDAVRGYGAEIIDCESTLQARESTVQKVIQETNAYFIHPYNDERIICGQATAAKELIEELDFQLDAILAPVGGGGLLSGTSLSAHYFSPGTKVIGAEPQGADDAYQSFIRKKLMLQTSPQTIADGLRTSLGEKTFEVIIKHVSEILLAGDDEIVTAMQLIWERMKIIIEPSAAVPLAVILKNPAKFKNQNIGVILSGGNIDFYLGVSGTTLKLS